MNTSLLVIGQPGRLRDSLCTILASFLAIDTILTADNFVLGCQIAAQQPPSAVIVDGGDYLTEDCHSLKELLRENGGCRCIIIVATREQTTQARASGADAVLLQGFSTDILLQTLVSLGVLPLRSTANEAKSPAYARLSGVQRAQKM